MFYYRYRTFSELSIKELLYSEIFLASTDECNDPYDSKAFYEFTANKLYWENLVKLIASKIKNVTIGERDVKRIAEKISATCPITYDEALKTDISGICGQVLSDSSLCRCFATCFNDILRLYKPEQSYFASFSKTDNDPLMWSHYASQHQGYCLVFKPINGELRQYHPLKKSSIRRQTPNGLATNSSYGLPESFKFQEIVYKDDVSPLCGFHRLPVAVVGGYLPEEERIHLAKSQSEQFIHKHKSWSYEQEVRVSITPRAAWLFGDCIELSPIERLFYFEPTQLVGIVFGARMPIKNRDRLMEVLLYRQNLLYRSVEHKRVMFDFAVFDAHLSGTNREIQTEISQMIVSGRSINKSDGKFQSDFDKWKSGWGIEFEGTKASKVQVLG